MIIAACYGVMMSFRTHTKKIIATTENNEPIPGLKVTLQSEAGGTSYLDKITTTNGTGEAWFTIEVPQSERLDHSVRIEDTDGADNLGNFASATVLLNEDKNDYPVTLQKKIVIHVNTAISDSALQENGDCRASPALSLL